MRTRLLSLHLILLFLLFIVCLMPRWLLSATSMAMASLML